jgi:hypothetical protein
MEKLKTFGKFIVKTFSICCVGILAFLFVTNYGATQFCKEGTYPIDISTSVPVFLNTKDVGPSVLEAMDVAREASYKYVEAELDIWIEEMLSRADKEFLDDYFSFMQVKRRELLGAYNSVVHFIFKDADTAEEAALKELEEEISRKVIIPTIAQSRIKNITDEAINLYATTLGKELDKVKTKYKISDMKWNEYISDLCGLTLSVESKSYPVAFKTAVVSGVTLSGYLAYPTIKKVVNTVSTKLVEKTAAKAGTAAIEGAAVKAVGKGAGKFAKSIPYVGMGVTAAICIWDIIDYSNSSAEGKALLKQNLSEYFHEVKKELLGSTEQSIMGTITKWENKIQTKI